MLPHHQDTSAAMPPIDANAVHGFAPNGFFGNIVSLMPGILYIFNHATQSNEYSNRSIAELLGYSQQSIRDMGDALLAKVIYPDDLAGFGDYFRSLSDLSDEQTGTFEFRAVSRTNKIVWLRSYDRVFERNPDGSALRHVGIANDITVEKNSALELVKANAELESRVRARTRALAEFNADLENRVALRTQALREANEELEQLTYVATHDLKVPINNMSRLADMLIEDRDQMASSQAELAEWMVMATGQATSKLHALVEVAKVRTEEMDAAETLLFDTTFKQSEVSLRQKINALGATLQADFSAAPQVSLPLGELRFIFDALIVNALCYARLGMPPVITLTSWKADGKIWLSVADNGTGLRLPEDEEKVFGLFRRAHTEPEGEGTSLYMIRKRQRRRGGTISVSSTLGQGTIFTLSFPFNQS